MPESILKKRKRNEKWASDNAAASAAATKKSADKKATIFKRAESYVAEYRNKEQQLTTMKRAARKAGTFYVPDEQKLFFVMRLRGINGMHPKTRHIMQVLRLLQINNGVFMRCNKATMNMLVKVDPYIMYGYPNLKTVRPRPPRPARSPPPGPPGGPTVALTRALAPTTHRSQLRPSCCSPAPLATPTPSPSLQVRDLIYKRGFLKVGKPPQRKQISDNAVVEEVLGEKTKGEVICVEDLVHQIYTAGPWFKECSKALWPFKMGAPVGGFSRIRHHFVEGGDAGNREEYINELLRRML